MEKVTQIWRHFRLLFNAGWTF